MRNNENWICIDKKLFIDADFEDLNFILQLLKWRPKGSSYYRNLFFVNASAKELDTIANFEKLSKIDQEFLKIQTTNAFTSGKNKNYKYRLLNEKKKESNEFNIQEAIRFFSSPVCLVIENSLNDSYFLNTIFEHFDKTKKILPFLDNDWIQYVNAGGWSNIKNYIEGRRKSLSNFSSKYSREAHHFLRCFVLMDSDKEFLTDQKLDKENLKKELEAVGIKVHILRKRAMENYIPDEIISSLSVINTQYRPYLPWANIYVTLTAEQKDFLSYKSGFPKIKIQNAAPKAKSRSEQNIGIQELYPFPALSNFNYGVLDNGLAGFPNFKENFPKFFEDRRYVYYETMLTREGGTSDENEFNEIIEKIQELL